jgi:Na+-translocating ferredoxin:NAD+ oxidoreductase RnfD subunit
MQHKAAKVCGGVFIFGVAFILTLKETPPVTDKNRVKIAVLCGIMACLFEAFYWAVVLS